MYACVFVWGCVGGGRGVRDRESYVVHYKISFCIALQLCDFGNGVCHIIQITTVAGNPDMGLCNEHFALSPTFSLETIKCQ